MSKFCEKCGAKIPNTIIEDGVRVNVTGRKYCFECNPKRKYPRPETSWTRMNPQERKQLLVDQLGGKCIVCGYNRSLRALQFHHLNGEDKDVEISALLRGTLTQVQLEISKCILLCSNCHSEYHDGMFSLLPIHPV